MKKFTAFTAILLVSVLILSLAGCGAKASTLNASCVSVTSSDFFQRYVEDGSSKDYILESFALGENAFENKFASKPDDWYGASLEISLTNTNTFDVTVLGIRVNDNGKDDVYVGTLGDAVIGLPASFDSQQSVFFDVLAGGAKSDEEILAAIKGMDIELIYVDSETGIDSLDDAAESDLKYEKIAG